MLRNLSLFHIALVVLCSASFVCAQPQPERQRFTLEGQIVGLQGSLLQVKGSDGTPWLLKVEVKPEDMQLSGTAEKGWIAPGMFVSFTGKFDGRGNSQEPVAEVTVFTPREGTPLGVTEEATIDGGSLFGADTAKPKKKGADEISTYLVNGRVAGVARDGKLNVVAGGTRISVELAENAVVKVEVSDPRLIRPGDSIEAGGWYYQRGKGVINGKLLVQAQPFKAPEDPKKARIRAREEAERARKADKQDAPEPAADKTPQ
ncbi:MAG: hypothetical protein ACIALR_06065 [Blastopirellula sp. JB062]